MAYDIAARQKLPSELKALSLANQNAALQNRILAQTAKFYEETGTSEASQKQQELDIRSDEADTSRGNLRARLMEFGQSLRAESREAMNAFGEQLGTIHRFSQLGGDPKEAEQMYNKIIQNTGMEEQLSGSILGKYDPRVVEAFASVSQVEDPLTPYNFIDLKTGKNYTVARDDIKGIRNAINNNWWVDPSGSMLQGVGGDVLAQAQGDAASIRAYATQERTYAGVFNLMDTLNKIITTTPGIEAGMGTTGAALRGIESFASQVKGMFNTLMQQEAPKQVQEKLDEGVVDREFNTLMDSMENGPIKSLIASSAELQTTIKMLVYSAAKLQGTNNDRLSDNDVRHFMSLFDVGSKSQLQAALRSMRRQMEFELKLSRRIMDPAGTMAQTVGTVPSTNNAEGVTDVAELWAIFDTDPDSLSFEQIEILEQDAAANTPR